MRLITRNSDYAVRVLLHLAINRKPAAVPELTEALGIPRAFLRQILQRLAKHGLLNSSKGRAGGFELARPPKAIRLIDVMGIFQGTVSLNECLFKKRLCPNTKTCPLRRRVTTLERDFLGKLSKVTLATLLRDASLITEKQRNHQ